MVSTAHMEWMVYYFDMNRQKMATYNALTCEKDIKKLLKKCDTKSEFAEELRKEMMYQYWSKAEWEIVISPWCGGTAEESAEKIDIYSQLKLNWDKLVDYCWSFKCTRSAKSR